MGDAVELRDTKVDACAAICCIQSRTWARLPSLQLTPLSDSISTRVYVYFECCIFLQRPADVWLLAFLGNEVSQLLHLVRAVAEERKNAENELKRSEGFWGYFRASMRLLFIGM
jgi:hypothetical protein